MFAFFPNIRNPELVRGNQAVLQVRVLAAKNFAVPGISYLFFSKASGTPNLFGATKLFCKFKLWPRRTSRFREYHISLQEPRTRSGQSSCFADSSFGREELRGSWNAMFLFSKTSGTPNLFGAIKLVHNTIVSIVLRQSK